jgi:hypothetical protein
MKFCLASFVLLMGIVPAAFGQALPAAEASPISTGFSLPLTAGTLQYALSGSESLTWGYYGNSGAATSTNITGDMAYISNSKRAPFSMVFAGGHAFSTSGQPSYSYLTLALSQVANLGRWSFVLSDNVNYMPGTPTAGLSGVPGVGDLGITPVQVGTDTGQGVLTDYSSRVMNTASASVQRQITGKTALNAAGSYSITRFLGASGTYGAAGLDYGSWSGQGGLMHQFDTRTVLGGQYSYSNVSYTGYNFGLPLQSFVSQTASGIFTRQVTRKLGVSVSAGPEWISLSSGTSSSTLSLFAEASATYAAKFAGASLAFVRNTNGGYGVIGGSISDSLSFTANRTFERVWNGALTSSYAHTSSLPLAGISPYTFNTAVVGVQVSRALARSFSTYASYSLQHQSGGGSAATVDVFTGLYQVLGFGLTYSPMSIHVGRP